MQNNLKNPEYLSVLFNQLIAIFYLLKNLIAKPEITKENQEELDVLGRIAQRLILHVNENDAQNNPRSTQYLKI